jgi:3-hydroxyacyl-CoA dehydrogenase
MSSSKVSASGVAAGRLSTIQRHLSSSSSNGKQVERMTVFGAGLMGAGIAQVGAQNGLKVWCLSLHVTRHELNDIGGFI